MKPELQKIVDNFHKYNSEHMAFQAFGLSEDTAYDALVIAPSFTPYKLGLDNLYTVTTMKEGAYIAGYEVKGDDLTIAWIKIGSSAGNLIDHLALCTELNFKRMIFIGAVGALKEGFSLGDICTPSYSISGSQADVYLKGKSIRDAATFEKVYPDVKFADEVIKIAGDKGYNITKASVFCTPSIALEYSRIDEIKAFDTDLIEMETASFALMTELMEIPGVALLVVSDNSASGAPLVGRSEQQQKIYDYGRKTVLPDMIITLARL